ncbi:ubiquitin carboxyl-terminal hydrolase 10-A-like isoform X1 [Schistocerca nitens]|uniref:ubiquitin carboxyl-terminal hydrolase 10-A-like isoform X1 n=2 Tax=Schistocerca nitens TaxID=7011 RepID=UPI0021197B06|nr:ubiquitin carboxyl-terminal hydrolase 10-A-like isoform X1 [Schistocerca nitens]
MDPTLQEFKFLDLTDIDEDERKHLHKVLYSADPSLQLPWDTPEYECHTDNTPQHYAVASIPHPTLQDVFLPQTLFTSGPATLGVPTLPPVPVTEVESTAVAAAAAAAAATAQETANPNPVAAVAPALHHHVRDHSPQHVTSPAQSPYHTALPHPQPPGSVVPIPPPPSSVTVPAPAMTTVYQMVAPHIPNVFVSNLTTNVNVHGYNTPPYGRHIPPQQAYQVQDVNSTPRDSTSSSGRRQKPGKVGSASRRQEIQHQFRGHDVQPDTSPGGASYQVIPFVHPFTYYQAPEHTPSQHAAPGTHFFMPVYPAPVYPPFHQQPATAAPVVYGTDVSQQHPTETVEAISFPTETVRDERSTDGYCVEPSSVPVVEPVTTNSVISDLNEQETTEYNQTPETIPSEGLQVTPLYDSSYSGVNAESSSLPENQTHNFSGDGKEHSGNAFVEEEKETSTLVDRRDSDGNSTVINKSETPTVASNETVETVRVENSATAQQEPVLVDTKAKTNNLSPDSPPKSSGPFQETLVTKLPSAADTTTTTTTTTTQIPRRTAVNTTAALINSDEVNQASTPGSGRSWASLFSQNWHSSPSAAALTNTVITGTPKPRATVRPFQSELMASADGPISSYKAQDSQPLMDAPAPAVDTKNFPQLTKSAADNPHLYRLGEFLSQYQLDHRAISLQPRGLTNRSNWCYINSTLQALLACPPFYNLMKALPIPSATNRMSSSSTPIIDSIVQFVNEFQPMPVASRVGRKEKALRKDDGTIEVQSGIAFEPSYIYKMLNSIRSNTFKVEGRQEDAEEFLSCLLNALNDEMQELMKLVQDNSQTNLSNGDIANGDAGQSQDEDETAWKEMGPKNRGSITRRADFGRTPISDIFRGQLRSRVQRAGDEFTDNVQPFFTLQLDIEKAQSVKDALELLVGKDQLEGVTCSKTNQQIEAWQQVTLEQLPYVLVLHLKWFDYKLDGCSKIVKTVEFPIDLKVDGKLMSSHKKGNAKQKQYKLFAVVYHDGKEATKGHYVTDVFHVGYGSWVRYDDSSVKAVQEVQMLHPRSPRVPYLLYYRRCDTIGSSTGAPSTVNSADRAR